MQRRSLLAGVAGAAALPRFAIGQNAAARTLKFVPQANLTSLDPIWTTANVTRNHGYMVYDTLFGIDARAPAAAADGRGPRGRGRRPDAGPFTLRDGLRFHDGEPVRAADCVASLQRWMQAQRASARQLARCVDELAALDDRHAPLPAEAALPAAARGAGQALATRAAFIMPERIAAHRSRSSRSARRSGSGPVPLPAGRVQLRAACVAYARNAAYVPRHGRAEPDRRAARSRISTGSNGTSSPMPRPPRRRCRTARSTGTSSRRRRSSSCCAATATSRSRRSTALR